MAWRTDFKGPPSSPPPVPPRSASPPPAYEETWHTPEPLASPMLAPDQAWRTGDPRSSSTQSLTQSLHDDDGRRILLIVYIHGFMGDNTSFRSFPAHVHYYLKSALAESHVIHSKLYPRYKTYKAIEVARDNFSKWLEPHESDKTDVVLVGHSMGGLLAAEVALMPSPNPVYGHAFKHRILGTVSLDAPLLGLHPGIIKAGLASLFRKAPDPPGKQQDLADSLASQNASGSLSPDDSMSFSTSGVTSSSLTLSGTPSNAAGPSQQDPNFNPPFFNDVPFVDRGWLRNVAHFAKKHYNDGLFSSTYQHLTSHLEFGSCLADYPGMSNRYKKIRQLEDVDALHAGAASGRSETRVRFINFYTASTGIPKEPTADEAALQKAAVQELATPKRSDTHLRPEIPASQSSQAQVTGSGASTPRISIEDYSDDERPQTMQFIDPVPVSDSEPEQEAANPPPSKEESKGKTPASVSDEQGSGDGVSQEDGQATAPASETREGEDDEFTSDLPPIPDAPPPPETPDFERYKDKDARKQAEKEFKRIQKTYDQAVKNRDKALKERQKLVEKRRKKAAKEAEKRAKDEEKRLAKEQKEKDAAAQKKSKEEEEEKKKEEEGDEAVGAATARSQVVTPAQAQALERQLTDLALHNDNANDNDSDAEADTPLSPAATTTTATTRAAAEKEKKPKKLGKFCMLPPSANGVRDPCWVKVHMEGVDEVGAHCGLFFAGPHYEKLVGDVGGMIVGWVQADMSVRAVLALD